MCHLLEMIISPSMITQANLAQVNFNYRGPLRNLHLMLENKVIVLREPIGSNSDSFCKLHVVPPLLRNGLFVCFHAATPLEVT